MTKGTNEIWFPMDLWQDVTLVPETWGISLSANILNPDEDFISTSLWNGIMNFEMDFKKEKKKKAVLLNIHWEMKFSDGNLQDN